MIRLFLISVLILTNRFGLVSQAEPDFFETNYRFQERLAGGLVFDILQDQQGFLWFGTEFGVIRYDGHQQKLYQNEPGNPYSLAGNVVTCLAEDAKGNLWVGTMNSGLHYFDRKTERFRCYQYQKEDAHSIAQNHINEILVDRDQSVWVTTMGGGVHLYLPKTDNFLRFLKPGQSNWTTDALLEDAEGQLRLGDFFGLKIWDPVDSLFVLDAGLQEIAPNGKTVKSLIQDSSGTLWAGLEIGGLLRLNGPQKKLERIITIPEWPDVPESNHIWDLWAEQEEGVLAATDGGLFHLGNLGQKNQFKLTRFGMTADRRFLSICKSRDGVLWLGTNDGVVVLTPRLKLFHSVRIPGSDHLDFSPGITAIQPASDHQFWIGTTHGLYQFDPVSRRFHQDFLKEYPRLQFFKEKNVSALYADAGSIWIALIEGFSTEFGIYRFDKQRQNLEEFSRRSTVLEGGATYHFCPDSEGNLWISTQNGLFRYHSEMDSLQLLRHDPENPQSLSSNAINQVLVSDEQQYWIATNDGGLDRYNLKQHQFEQFTPSQLENKLRILTMAKEGASGLWLGTKNGLVYFNFTKQQFDFFDSRRGLQDNVIKGMNIQKGRAIWVSTQTGVSRFDLHLRQFENYGPENGLPIQKFWDRVQHQDAAGRLYFGGEEGLLFFHPDSIQENDFLPPVVFTGFRLFNETVAFDSTSTVLPAPIERLPTITLRQHQNIFTIQFAALSFIASGDNRFAVKMEGFEQDWQQMGTKNEATYTNLNPGRYTFRVRAANGDGRWNPEEAAIAIRVLPPWYRTTGAIAGYSLVFLGSIALFYFFLRKRWEAEAEAHRLRELDLIKSRLYTDITHEFRTPITLIQGPVERALQDSGFTLGEKHLDAIRRNCRRLLHLIQQLLDLNKLESGVLKPRFGYGDIISRVRYLVDSFTAYADSQGVGMEFKSDTDSLMMDMDQEKVLAILTNLLSNAVKFTPASGTISVQVSQTVMDSQPVLQIDVEDTGIGIPENEQKKIFDRFYRVSRQQFGNRDEAAAGGAGIGLALSKRLAELLGGQLRLQSVEQQGSVFSLLLPITHHYRNITPDPQPVEVYIPETSAINGTSPVAVQAGTAKRARILIVEDNSDVSNFVAEQLAAQYELTAASDGQVGVDQAIAQIPDLIISDVRMPKVDGYTLVKTLKKDHRTSHIPIILLTAKVDLQARIFGLGRGADAYMTKPFNSLELQVRVENLLESRRQLQNYYLQQTGLFQTGKSSDQSDTYEYQFLEKARQLVEQKLDSGEYSIEQLAADLRMSPSQLYRKMMALTGLPPSRFYRNIQLRQARQFLESGELTIAQIAFSTGFNDPAYFSRVFQAEHGISPSKYRKQELR